MEAAAAERSGGAPSPKRQGLKGKRGGGEHCAVVSSEMTEESVRSASLAAS